MSNYYISKCCKKGATWIDGNEKGICLKCLKECELEAVIDNRFCCGGDYCEGDHNGFIKSFITTEVVNDVIDECVKEIDKMKSDISAYSDKENYPTSILRQQTGYNSALSSVIEKLNQLKK